MSISRHRVDRLRLPDVVPREVHRALPAGAHVAGQPELSRRHDGQAARRLRAEHRVHAGAARRAAASDGDGRAGFRATTAAGSKPPASTRRSSRRWTASSPRRSSAAPTRRTTRSRRSTPARWPTPPSCRSAPSGLRPGDHLAERSGGDAAVRGGVPDAGHSVHLGSGPAVRAHGRRRAARRPVRRAARHLQRLRVRADPAEDRARRSRRSSRRPARSSSRAARRAARLSRTDRKIDVPAVPPHRIVDPTGVGDAFRGGFMKGMAHRRGLRHLRAARQRGGHLRARAPGRTEPRLHLARVPPALRSTLRRARRRTLGERISSIGTGRSVVAAG